MIQIIRPDKDNYLILKHIYDQYKEEMDADDFSLTARENCMFFFDTDSESLIGCIYLYKREDKTFVNAFATRGHHLLNLHILKQVLKLFSPVYAEPLSKTSKLCVLRCGFKKYKDNIYKYERLE